MAAKQRKLDLKDIIICAAFILAYQEYAKSQRFRGTPLSLDEITDHLWEELTLVGRADILTERYRKLFRFLFEQEFKTFSSLAGNKSVDVIEKTELFFRQIGYEPVIKIRRE